MTRQTQPGTFGERLRRARQHCNWTQQQLSERSGVLQATISRIELNEIDDPGHSVIRALERALGVEFWPAEGSLSLHRFLQSPLAHVLGVTTDEAMELRRQWWSGRLEDEPTDEEWYDYVQLRRRVAARILTQRQDARKPQ